MCICFMNTNPYTIMVPTLLSSYLFISIFFIDINIEIDLETVTQQNIIINKYFIKRWRNTSHTKEGEYHQ